MVYVQEHYAIPPDFERTLVANLKILTENRRLIKVLHLTRFFFLYMFLSLLFSLQGGDVGNFKFDTFKL